MCVPLNLRSVGLFYHSCINMSRLKQKRTPFKTKIEPHFMNNVWDVRLTVSCKTHTSDHIFTGAYVQNEIYHFSMKPVGKEE